MENATTSAAPSASTRRALGDIAVQLVGRLLNGLAGVVVLIVLTRGLGTARFGQWTTLSTIVFLATTVTDLGLTSVAVTRAAERPEDEEAWLGALLIVRVVLSAIGTLACIAAVQALATNEDMRQSGVLASAAVLLGGFGAVAAVFQLRVRNDLAIVVMTVNSVVWTAGAILVTRQHGSLLAVGVAFLIGNAAAAATQLGLALRRVRPRLAGWEGRARELVRVGLPLSVGTLLVYAYARVDQILVFEYVGQRGAGLYGTTYRVLDQSMILPMSVTTTLYPLMVRAYGSGGDVTAVLQRSLEMMGAIALGVLATSIACGGDVLALLFGDPYRAAGPTLAILMGVFVVISVNYLNGSLVLILGLQKANVAIALAGLVLNVGANIALLPHFGYVAAAWVTLATELLVLGLTTRLTLRALGWRPRLGVLARATAAAAATSAALALLNAAGVPIGVLLVCAVIVYGVLLVAVRGIDLEATRGLVARRSPA